MIVAASGVPVASLLLMLTHGVLSASVTGACEAFANSVLELLETRDASSGRRGSTTHLSPSFFARSPPLAKIHEMPLRQSWPPM